MQWCLEFDYTDYSKCWADGVVVFHPLSGDTFELNDLAHEVLRCLDRQQACTTDSLLKRLMLRDDLGSGEVEHLPRILAETLKFLQDYQLVRAL